MQVKSANVCFYVYQDSSYLIYKTVILLILVSFIRYWEYIKKRLAQNDSQTSF